MWRVSWYEERNITVDCVKQQGINEYVDTRINLHWKNFNSWQNQSRHKDSGLYYGRYVSPWIVHQRRLETRVKTGEKERGMRGLNDHREWGGGRTVRSREGSVIYERQKDSPYLNGTVSVFIEGDKWGQFRRRVSSEGIEGFKLLGG